ncbi:MAG: serine/threonine protein kinase [Blastocatellia bacterium]
MPTKGDFLNNNRYQILRVLSDQGGMGVVYLATDLSFHDTVVIKHSRFTEQFIKQQYPTLPPDQMRQFAERLRKAFAREARLLRGLKHPALPQVIDYFTVGDDQQFFVMEFIEGQDFDEMLEERKLQQKGLFAWAEVRDWAD